MNFREELSRLPTEDVRYVDKLTSKLSEMSILVVNSDPHFCSAMSEQLEALGFQSVMTVSSERALLGIITFEAVDLIVSELGMPSVSGSDLVGMLSDFEHLRMTSLLLTYHSYQISELCECLRNGADDGLSLPLNFELLGARVRSSLERRYLRCREINLACEVVRQRRMLAGKY